MYCSIKKRRMAIAATRSQHDASGAAMIHLSDIGPARIRHVHVGVLLKEKREDHRLLSGKHGKTNGKHFAASARKKSSTIARSQLLTAHLCAISSGQLWH